MHYNVLTKFLLLPLFFNEQYQNIYLLNPVKIDPSTLYPSIHRLLRAIVP